MNPLAQLDPGFAIPPADAGVVWHDALGLGIGGKGWADTIDPYHRLPAHARHQAIPGAWSLARCSTGLYVRFLTTAGRISCGWLTRSWATEGRHMNGLCLSGVDLYVRERGRLRFLGSGAPEARQNAALLCDVPDAQTPREFCLYLPLYNGVYDVKIGVAPGHNVLPAPPWPGRSKTGKPILVYGTSITQGGCASRPGMCYTSIVQRLLDRDVINLGFSGNGPIYHEFFKILAEIDCSVFVMDGVANSTPQMVRNETYHAIKTYRALRPGVPIVLVEPIQSRMLVDGIEHRGNATKNRLFREQVRRLIAEGMTDLHVIPSEALREANLDGTVDGGHPNDIGFLHLAQVIAPVLRNLG